MNSIKNIAIAVLNLIHQKLKTKEGQLSLIIAGSLITGASIVTINLKGVRIEELMADKKEQIIQIKSIENTVDALRQEIKDADKSCNEKILEGARFQRELKSIFDGKIETNEKVIKIKEPLLKEKAATIQTTKKNIEELTKLNERL